ncbi:glycosyltransferase family 9 protein [Vibrio sp. 99-8-1]|uniref:glycosyltransferase family 9 protein n=1 Tax=Vibrio sp. 99-8-1 TaxID=2607602 RepID=UPI001493630D|nr:glycosyltransferase family 9 protein [Vibrio sp. 99-8-1]NOI66969.1 glycosyltransferase family 9 protein [Vibrio sp. 99-8-1]
MQKILVVRNDKIGDFMLAWPSFAMLKESMPESHITALVPRYTAELARQCPWIDDVIIDPTKSADKSDYNALLQTIKKCHFDAAINLFSTTYNAMLVWRAGIPYRLAPATKFAQIFYNHRVKQRRSQSAKPEYQYNMDLIRVFLSDNNVAIIEPSAPYFQFDEDALAAQKTKLAKQLGIDSNLPWVFVHSGTGGSSNALANEQYQALISGLDGEFETVLTAGPGEEENARKLLSLISAQGDHCVVYDKNDGLVDFSCSLACASLFIAGSTGPLHISAALDVPTVGFFPAKRSSTPLRWMPINSAERHIAFTPQGGKNQEEQSNMTSIDIEQVLTDLNPWACQYLS